MSAIPKNLQFPTRDPSKNRSGATTPKKHNKMLLFYYQIQNGLQTGARTGGELRGIAPKNHPWAHRGPQRPSRVLH